VRKWAQETNGMSRFPPSTPAGFLDWYTEELAHSDLEAVIAFSKFCSSYNQIEYLPRIKAPVLGIYARTREEQMALLRKHVARVNLIRLETDYFMFFPVCPRLCAEAVLNFCARHDGIPCTE